MAKLPDTIARVFMRLAQVAAALFVLFTVAFFAIVLIGGSLLTRFQHTLGPRAESELRTLLGRDVRIDAVQIRGLNQVVFQKLAIADGQTFAGGTAATITEARADINLLSLVWHRGRNPMDAIDRITVMTPNLEINRVADGRWDFQDVIDRLNANMSARSGLRAPVTVADGPLTVHDAQGFGVQAAPMTQRLVCIRGSLASRGGQNYRFLVSARDAARQVGEVTLAGDYSGGRSSARVKVEADDIAVNAVAKFLPGDFPIAFENGTAALRLSALFTSLPAANGAISTDKLTAEVDLSGVGLRLREMSAPIMATSGRLRLVHDRQRNPRGSRLEFINVRAHAGQIPLTLSGELTDLNLFDLAHARPQVALTLTASGQGAQFQRLFPKTKWLQEVSLAGDAKLTAEVTGKPADLHIDGTLDNERIGIRGMQLDGAVTAFHLSPGVTTAGTRPSLVLNARVRHAALGESEYQNLQLALSSTTPWGDLEKNLLLHGSASVGQARMPWGTANDIRGEVTVTRDGVQFDEIRAGLFGGEVSAGPLVVPLNMAPGGIVLRASGSYRDIDLAQLTKALDLKDLFGTGQGTISLTLDDAENLHITTDLHATGVTYQGKRVNEVTATLQVDSHDGTASIAIPTADAQTEYGRFIIAGGSYHRDGSQPGNGALNLPVHGDGVNLQKYYDKLTGSAVLDGTVQGDLSAPTLTAHASADNGVLLGRDFTHAESDLEYSASDLRLRNIVFTRDGMTGRVVDDGTGLDPRKSLVGLVATLELHGASVDNITSLFGTKSPWQIDGGAVGTVDVRYTDHGLVFGGSATIPNTVVHVPADGDYSLTLDRLGLTFSYADRKMQIQDLALERNATILHGRGSAECPVGGQLRADVDFNGVQARLEDLPLDLFHIPVPLNGNAQIAGTLHGILNGAGPEPLTVDVDVAAPRFAAAGLPMKQGSVDLQYRYRKGARELIVRRGMTDGTFHAEGAGHFYPDQRRMEGVTLAVTDLDLAKLSALMGDADLPVTVALPDSLAGQGRISLSADGSYAKPDVTLGFTLDHLAFGKALLPDLRGQLHGIVTDGHYRLHINELTAARAGTDLARVTGDIDPGNSVNLQVAATNLTAKLLAPWAPGLPFDGQADFTGAVNGPWKNPALEGDLRLANLNYNGQSIPRASGHVRLDASQLALSNGQVQLLPTGQLVQVSGQVPVRWDNFHPRLPQDQPLSLAIELPRQDLAALRPLLPPAVKSLTGSVAGGLRVVGTVGQPRFRDGWVEIQGNAGFKLGNPGFADSLRNLDLRASITGDPRQSKVTLERLSATVAQSRKGGQSGYLIAGGSVGIASVYVLQPQHWQWDVNVNVSNVPLPASLVLAPKATAALHLVSEGSTPVLKGVVVLDHVKLKQPKMTAGGGTWGPFIFDPRLSIAVHVGGGVKISKSIFSVPLQSTPLPLPEIVVAPGAMAPPGVSLDAYDAMFSRAGTANELTGTWGAITGTLNDPQVYARFEVDKHHLAFPLSLIGSVRHARGHVTYTRADGPRIVMGIPDFPTENAKTPAPPTPAPAMGLR